MARRGQRTSYQQRIQIGGRASAGESDREIGPVHGLLGLDGAQVALHLHAAGSSRSGVNIWGDPRWRRSGKLLRLSARAARAVALRAAGLGALGIVLLARRRRK
jgi:hypothetical protein